MKSSEAALASLVRTLKHSLLIVCEGLFAEDEHDDGEVKVCGPAARADLQAGKRIGCDGPSAQAVQVDHCTADWQKWGG